MYQFDSDEPVNIIQNSYRQVTVELCHHLFQNDEFLDLTNYLCPEAIEKT